MPELIHKKYLHNHLEKFLLLLFIGTLLSCKNSSQDMQNEFGSLLWIGNDLHENAINKAIHTTLEHSSVIVAQVPWSPEESTHYHSINWYRNLASHHGKNLMINIDWLNNPRTGTRGNWSFDDINNQQLFIKDIKRIINTFKPDYITLGIEVNYYALTNSGGYSSFINIYNKLKNHLQETYPNLKIGLSFQLELLYGKHKDWKQIKTIQTLNAVVENLDYLALSTYPSFHIKNDIFSSLALIESISNSYDIPIGISETGLISNTYTDNQRHEYIRQLFKKYRELDLQFVIWGSMIDGSDLTKWEKRIGLLNNNGLPKPEFQTWEEEINK